MATTPGSFTVNGPSDDVCTVPDGNDQQAEAALVAALRKGDDSAYEELVRSCGALVLAVARRYLNSDADASDCFQETFIAITRSIDSFAGQSSLRQWVRGVCVNQCLMALRKRRRGREDSIEHMMPQFDESGRRIQTAGAHPQPALELQLDAQERRRAVRQCIQKLPDSYRLVILLRDIDGYNTSETAAILGIRTNTVKTRLHRARSALKYMMEPLLEQANHDVDV